MLVFFRTSTEAIGTVFSTPSRSDVAQECAYEGSHDAKAAGNLPASPNATRSPMDSISLHWNTSPQLPAALPAAHPLLAAGSCLRARQPAGTRHGTGSANLLHQHPTPRPRRIRNLIANKALVSREVAEHPTPTVDEHKDDQSPLELQGSGTPVVGSGNISLAFPFAGVGIAIGNDEASGPTEN